MMRPPRARNFDRKPCHFTQDKDTQGGIRMTSTSRASRAGAGVVGAAQVADGGLRGHRLGVDGKVILTPPCIFCMENH
jgi:hypothetical protein